MQHTLSKKELHQSGVDCLNLNITVPSDTTASSKLPVFLFTEDICLVLALGRHNFTRFVRLSTEKKLPIVAVSFKLVGLFYSIVLSTITDSVKLPVGSFWILDVG